ncbi:hypothetical protein [Halorubrum sp. HHNYT27]|uniref:hypothetical protein n=1 Tax=Halorubrum sp. HHNYT27 TaxID=3402275 RepID=UPI003EC0A94A
MSLSQYDRVQFAFGDQHLVGDAVDFVPAGDVSGPDGLLIVDVNGLEYRVAESDAERLDQ